MINLTLGERVYENLRDRIMVGIYKPGDRLLYAVLSQELEVSLSPIKEALLHLSQEGLVTLTPRKGAYVSRVSERDVAEYSWIRLALESLACERICIRGISEKEAEKLAGINRRLAAAISKRDINLSMQMDNEFHLGLVSISDNRRLIETVKQLPLANFSVVAGAQDYMLRNGEVICRTHGDIIDALCRGDKQACVDLLEQNIISPLKEILPQL